MSLWNVHYLNEAVDTMVHTAVFALLMIVLVWSSNDLLLLVKHCSNDHSINIPNWKSF